mmetsp:Transcript_14429/g.23385  ORF Transcript_14429/g.23385 Transcript_14429/m.23385 type:complete len:88 (-) Transcript_14429:679-942(-)
MEGCSRWGLPRTGSLLGFVVGGKREDPQTMELLGTCEPLSHAAAMALLGINPDVRVLFEGLRRSLLRHFSVVWFSSLFALHRKLPSP